MSKLIESLIKGINSVNNTAGLFCGIIVLIMAFTTSYEVFVRAVFNEPTMWSVELNINLLVTLAILSGGYVLLKDGHVRVDIFFVKLPLRVRALLGLLGCLLLLTYCSVLIWKGSEMTLASFTRGQLSAEAMHWPLWPSQLILPLGGILIGLQALIKLGCDIFALIKNREIELWKEVT